MRMHPLLSRSLLVLTVGTLGVSAAACGSSSSPRTAAPLGAATAATDDTTATITAVGVGKITGIPDLLTVSLGVHAEGSKANATLRDMSALAQKVIDEAKRQGVASADLATTNVSLNPRYDNNGRSITGYSADEGFSVKLRDQAKAGTAIDALSALGDGVQLQGVSYSFADDSVLLAKAREAAVRAARSQADQLAQAGGVRLGGVLRISEATQAPTPPYYALGGAAASAADKAVPLAPGSQDVSLTVTVVYTIA